MECLMGIGWWWWRVCVKPIRVENTAPAVDTQNEPYKATPIFINRELRARHSAARNHAAKRTVILEYFFLGTSILCTTKTFAYPKAR